MDLHIIYFLVNIRSTNPIFINIKKCSWSRFVRKEQEFSWCGEKCLEIIFHPKGSPADGSLARGTLFHLWSLFAIPTKQKSKDTLCYLWRLIKWLKADKQDIIMTE